MLLKHTAINFGKKPSGLKIGDMHVIPGGLSENLAHFEKLLVKAGMTKDEFFALYKKVGAGINPLQRGAAMLIELRERGLLPLSGRAPAAAAPATAAVDDDAPAELVNKLADLQRQVENLTGGTPAVAASLHLNPLEVFRVELKSLEGKRDEASILRKAVVCKFIRQIKAGTYVPVPDGKAEALRAELSALSSHYTPEANVRKTIICRELRSLRSR